MDNALFDQHADLEDRHWWFVGRRQVMRALVEAVLPPGEGGVVIDVGAGTGANLASLADQYRVVGLEPSEHAVAHAHRRFPGITFLQTEDTGLVARHATARSVVMLMDVAEHVADDFLLISRLVAALPVGAHLLLTVPANPRLWSAHDVAFGHHRRYSVERLCQVWRDLPVEVRLFMDFNTRLAPVVRVARAIGRMSARPRRGGSDLRMPVRPLNRLLAMILGGEATRLVARLDCPDAWFPSGMGVSLLAFLRRVPGDAPVRGRPATVLPDTAYRR